MADGGLRHGSRAWVGGMVINHCLSLSGRLGEEGGVLNPSFPTLGWAQDERQPNDPPTTQKFAGVVLTQFENPPEGDGGGFSACSVLRTGGVLNGWASEATRQNKSRSRTN